MFTNLVCDFLLEKLFWPTVHQLTGMLAEDFREDLKVQKSASNINYSLQSDQQE